MDNKAYEGNEERIRPPPSYTDAIQLNPSRLEGLVTDPIDPNPEAAQTTVIHVIQPTQVDNRSHNAHDVKFAFQFPQEIYCYRCSGVHVTKTFYSQTSHFRFSIIDILKFITLNTFNLLSWMLCFFMFLFGCWPCCFIPFCFSCFKGMG